MKSPASQEVLPSPDPAVLAIARALARQAAREDHAAELARAALDQRAGNLPARSAREQD